MTHSTSKLVAMPGRAGAGQSGARYWDGNTLTTVRDFIADETPVALTYNCLSYAVMLATPNDLEDFALGFSLSEGIVESPDEVFSIIVQPLSNGVQVKLNIALPRLELLKKRRRNLAGRTGCGLCGTETISQVFRPLPDLLSTKPFSSISPTVLAHAYEMMERQQPLHEATGAVHAAALSNLAGNLQLVREDIGRHNALDKLIGAMAKQTSVEIPGFVILTSRASSEMVQKAASAGVTLLAAVSAPTRLAVQMAEKCGMTLIGFARKGRFTVYTHGQRITADATAQRAM